MIYPIAPNGIFWTIQGEGALLGEPMVFVRLAGCSVGCKDCDTDYRVDRRLSIEDIYKEIRIALSLEAGINPWVWITGGEPTDHDLRPLVDCLKSVGLRVALATAGTRSVSCSVDWLSVSPHSAALQQRRGNEIKVVPHLNGLTWRDIEPFSHMSFTHRFIQPMWWQTVNGLEKDEEASNTSTKECLEFLRSHPTWKMGIQAHKYWRVP